MLSDSTTIGLVECNKKQRYWVRYVGNYSQEYRMAAEEAERRGADFVMSVRGGSPVWLWIAIGIGVAVALVIYVG